MFIMLHNPSEEKKGEEMNEEEKNEHTPTIAFAGPPEKKHAADGEEEKNAETPTIAAASEKKHAADVEEEKNEDTPAITVAGPSEKKRKFELPLIWQAAKRFASSATAMFGSPNPSTSINNDQPPPQNEEAAAARAGIEEAAAQAAPPPQNEEERMRDAAVAARARVEEAAAQARISERIKMAKEAGGTQVGETLVVRFPEGKTAPGYSHAMGQTGYYLANTGEIISETAYNMLMTGN